MHNNSSSTISLKENTTKIGSITRTIQELLFFSSSRKTSVNKRALSQGAKLVEIAVEEFETGNEAIALDIYLSGLDKIIMALPNLNSLKTKQTLTEKLSHLQNRLDIPPPPVSQHDNLVKFKLLGQSITNMILQCTLLFKKSPVPGFLYLLFSFFVYFVIWINDQLKITEKIQNMSIHCIDYFLKIDEKYHLHEYASESIYFLLSTLLKTMVIMVKK